MKQETATMLYDGTCQFCLRAVRKWQENTGAKIAYQPYQTSLHKFPHVSEKACERAVQLITADGKVYAGAHAVFKAFDLAGKYKFLHACYHSAPFFDAISEAVYAWVARNRSK
jgi:predicted DCC family thiol-disulfide oxidoreductase YuxK